MRHALIYHGSFERNFANLTQTSSTFEGTDGATHAAAAWPTSADGLRVTYMEKAGKNFCAVRIADQETQVALANDVELQPGRHYGFSVRLSGEPTLIEDDVAAMVLLDDIIRRNSASQDDLRQIRERLKAGMDHR